MDAAVAPALDTDVSIGAGVEGVVCGLVETWFEGGGDATGGSDAKNKFRRLLYGAIPLFVRREVALWRVATQPAGGTQRCYRGLKSRVLAAFFFFALLRRASPGEDNKSQISE